MSHGKIAQLCGDHSAPACAIPISSARVVTRQFILLVSKNLLNTVEAAILALSQGGVAQLCGDHSAPTCGIATPSARVVTRY